VRSELVVGFGLSGDKDIVSALRAGADGIAVGTAVISELEKEGVTEGLKLVSYYRGVIDGV